MLAHFELFSCRSDGELTNSEAIRLERKNEGMGRRSSWKAV